MTREEAIADIRDNIKPVVGGKSLDMAIEALEQQPCEDCISRQAVVDMLTQEWTKYMPMELDINLSFVLDKISELPSVAPRTNLAEISQDCISRAEAIVQLSHNKIRDDDCDVIIQKDIETIKQLPPVTPKGKIIHCKDCKYRDYWGDCTKWSKELDAHKTYLLDENMFCGFAEIGGDNRKASEREVSE